MTSHPSPAPSPLRLGFIGGHGHHYLRRALDDPTLKIDAVAVASDGLDAQASRGKFEAALEGGGKWYDDPLAMMDQFKPTALSVGAVYAHTGPLVAQAVQRGIPTVADKPIAATWDDLSAIEQALGQPTQVESKAGTQAMVLTELPFRSNPAFRAAARAVHEGQLGTIALATAQKSYRFGNRPDFYRRREDYGSTMLWVASHGIDAIGFVTGLAYERIGAQHGNLTKPDYEQMEDHAVAMFTLEGGAGAVVHGDLLRPQAAPTHGDDRLRIVGGSGQIEIRDGRCTLITHDQGPSDITDTVEPRPMHLELLSALAGEENPWYNTGQSLELAHILLATRDEADRG